MFKPHSKHYSTGAKQLLILDDYSSHQTVEFDIFCKKNIIICLCMPPHTSHLLQPLDVGVFGPLKHTYGKLVEGIMAASNNYIDKEDFLSLYPSACKKVFTRENICSGFTGTGLKLLDKDQVLEKITFQLCTPTPSLVEGSIFSAFQTPQNPHQLDCKVCSLQKSLSTRKLFSSPISYIQYLEKTVQMAINVNLLLQQEIKVLQAENKQKMKKKIRKCAILDNDLVLFVQEGQNCVQQLDTQLNEHVDEPTPRPCQ